VVLTRRSLDVSAKVLLVVVALGAFSYYVAVARTTDISFDGAIFLQPIVSLERWGSLTQTYNVKSPADFHIPLTNLGQGMLSQYIINWPVIHLFGINHFTLQFSNLVFLALTAFMICLLIVRMTGSWPLSLAGVILFFTTPEIKALGLEGHGEVAGAFYLLVCAFVLRKALLGSRRYFYLLGFAVFLAAHTKNYLVVVFPMLLMLLVYLWLRQRSGWVPSHATPMPAMSVEPLSRPWKSSPNCLRRSLLAKILSSSRAAWTNPRPGRDCCSTS